MTENNKKGPKNVMTQNEKNNKIESENIKNSALTSALQNQQDISKKEKFSNDLPDKLNEKNTNVKDRASTEKSDTQSSKKLSNQTANSKRSMLADTMNTPDVIKAAPEIANPAREKDLDQHLQSLKNTNIQNNVNKEQSPTKNLELETIEKGKSNQDTISTKGDVKATTDDKNSSSQNRDMSDQINEAERLINDARMAMVYGNFSRATQLLSQAMSIISNNPLLRGSGLEGSVQAVKSEMIEVQSGYNNTEFKSFQQISNEEAQAQLQMLEKNIHEYASSHYRDEHHKQRIHSMRDDVKKGEKLDKSQLSEYSSHVLAEDNEERKNHISNLEVAIKNIENKQKRGQANDEDLKKLEHFKREYEGEKTDYQAHKALRNLASEAGHKDLPAARNYISSLQHTDDGAQKVQEAIFKATKQSPEKSSNKDKDTEKSKKTEPSKEESAEKSQEEIKQNLKKFMESSPTTKNHTLTPPSTPKATGPNKGPAIGG